MGDRGGGTSSPSPSASPPVAISTTVQHMGRSRRNPGYGCSPDIRPGTDPAPAGGGGGAPQARAGWGLPAEAYECLCRQRRGRGGGAGRSAWVSPCEGAGGVGDAGEVRYLEHGRQGRGNSFPLPVSPTPNGDIPTVQHMGRSWRRAGHGGPPATPRIRLLT